MEYTIDLGGNLPEEAAAGAAAMRDEGAAATSTTAALAGLSKTVDALAAALGKVSSDTVGTLGQQALAARGPWAQLAGNVDKVNEAKLRAAAGEKSAKAAGAKSESKTASGPATKGGGGSSGGAALGAVAGGAALVTGAVVALGAAIHTIANSELTRMAIGWRASAQLTMLSWKTTMDLRRAVMGVDAQPLVRTFKHLEENLSKSTVTGSALSGLLTRGFQSAFGAVESLQGAADYMIQNLVLGALKVEGAWLDARIAIKPLSDEVRTLGTEISTATAPIYDFGAAAAKEFPRTAAFISAVGDAVWNAIVPFDTWLDDLRLLTAGLHALNDGIKTIHAIPEGQLLNRLIDPSSGDEGSPGVPIDTSAQVEKARAARDSAGKATTESASPWARAGGAHFGEDYADGIVEGVGSRTGDLAAAGEKAAQTVIDAAREKAGAHSPATETIAFGQDLGAGAVVGLDRSAPAVQAAADRSLVPDLTAPPPRAAASSASPAGGLVVNLGGISVTVEGGRHAEDLAQLLREQAPDILQSALRVALARLGIPF